MQNRSSHRSFSLNSPLQMLRLYSAQEKIHRALHSVDQFMRTGQIHRPLPDYCVVEPFHKFRQMNHRKRAGDVAAVLTLCQNVPMQICGRLLVLAQLGRSYGIHGARQHNRFPQLPVGLYLASHARIKPAQTLGCSGFARKLRTQALANARVSALSHFAQNRIFSRKIAKECRLADFKDAYYVVDARRLVSMLAKQLDRRLDNLLPQARLLTLAEPDLIPFFEYFRRRTSISQRTGHSLFLQPRESELSDRGKATSHNCEGNYNKRATIMKMRTV